MIATTEEKKKIMELLARDVIFIARSNPEITSYGLKHLVENQLGFYVSNETFKILAVEFGLKAYGNRSSPKNPHFNISQKTVRLWQKRT